MKGLFVAFEGPDGSGKSTAAKGFAEELRDRGYDAIRTREPGGTPIGEKIRDIILDNDNGEITSMTEAILYAGARAQHVEEKIIPLLEEGKIVITDRFVVSSLAYQGYARGLGVNKVKELNDYAIGDLTPDITFFFEISPEEALARKFVGREADRMENEGAEFHKKTYEGYQEAVETQKNVIRIDASKSKGEVLKQCVDAFLKHIDKNK